MNSLSKDFASWHEIREDAAGQRVDNYLMRLLKGVPKSHVYRILRNGEVRVNSGRVGPDYRLKAGDRIRVPPVRTAQRVPGPRVVGAASTAFEVLYEDDTLLALNKPPGVAVHGGSGVSHGVIEQLRMARPHAPFLELVHRLDRDTSGVLLVAKKRSALVALHEELRTGKAQKFYLAIVYGRWTHGVRKVELPLHKYVLPSGERRVKISEAGSASVTVFRPQAVTSTYSVLQAELKTGRTHQIRVHLAHLGYPIVGDDKYGDSKANREAARHGLKRMALHACRMSVRHPVTGAPLDLKAPLPADLSGFLDRIETPIATTV